MQKTTGKALMVNLLFQMIFFSASHCQSTGKSAQTASRSWNNRRILHGVDCDVIPTDSQRGADETDSLTSEATKRALPPEGGEQPLAGRPSKNRVQEDALSPKRREAQEVNTAVESGTEPQTTNSAHQYQTHFRGGEIAPSKSPAPHVVGTASATHPSFSANSRTAAFLRAGLRFPQIQHHHLPAQQEQPATGTPGRPQSVTVGTASLPSADARIAADFSSMNSQGIPATSPTAREGTASPPPTDSPHPEEPARTVDGGAADVLPTVHRGTSAMVPAGDGHPVQRDSSPGELLEQMRVHAQPTHQVNLVKVRHLHAASGSDFGTASSGFPQRSLHSTNLLGLGELDPDMPLIDVSLLQQPLRARV